MCRKVLEGKIFAIRLCESTACTRAIKYETKAVASRPASSFIRQSIACSPLRFPNSLRTCKWREIYNCDVILRAPGHLASPLLPPSLTWIAIQSRIYVQPPRVYPRFDVVLASTLSLRYTEPKLGHSPLRNLIRDERNTTPVELHYNSSIYSVLRYSPVSHRTELSTSNIVALAELSRLRYDFIRRRHSFRRKKCNKMLTS